MPGPNPTCRRHTNGTSVMKTQLTLTNGFSASIESTVPSAGFDQDQVASSTGYGELE